MTKKALIILAPGFEEIEAVTPIDILRRADINVTIASLNAASLTVTGSHGIKITADSTLEDLAQDFDALVLPGGPGAKILAESEKITSLVLDMNANKKLIAAICAAPAVVLAPTGILDNKRATCYPGLERNFSKTTKFCPDPVIVDGNIITSRGPGTALAFSLAIVEALSDTQTARSLKEKTLVK